MGEKVQIGCLAWLAVKCLWSLSNGAYTAWAGGPGSSANGTLGGLAVPFLRGGHLRSSMHRSYSVGLANSPVNGLLYVRGTIGAFAAFLD